MIHTGSDNAAEHPVHNAAVWQENAAQDSDVSVQAAEEKTEQ